MKNISIIFSLSLTIFSCSTLTSNSNKVIKAELSSEELEKIENSDFLPVKEIKYQVKLDKFDFAESEDLTFDSLGGESIARVPEKKLEQISKEEDKDPISAIISLCYQGSFEEAELIMDKIYKRYKNHPSYWNQIGTCYYLRDNMRKALLYYNKSRSLSKEYAPSINNLGVIYQQQGLEQKALLAFKKASELSSFSLTPVFNLAQIYLKYGFSRRARTLFQALLRKSPRDNDALAGLATSLLLENKLVKSIETYLSIPDRLRRRANVGLNLSIAFKLAGRLIEAQNTFDNIDKGNLESYAKYYNKVEQYIRGVK